MVFSSPIFLFLFFPIVLFIYYSLSIKSIPLKFGNLFILLSSLFFYTWGEFHLVFVMLASTVINFYCAYYIEKFDKRKIKKSLLFLSIITNLSLLFYFKYYNFSVTNINYLVEWIGLTERTITNIKTIALPLGISFYTFQSMGYTIDVYLKRTVACNSYLNFACYVTMFPQLVAGPIVRYADIAKQLTSRTVSREKFSSGCMQFIRGLVKKVLIANVVAIPADYIFGLEPSQLTMSLAWLGAISYTLQIYYDFSGYSDMAIGMGRMMGFDFLENFNHPYQAKSMQDFWRRWHISLSTWFRDNLYIPLGGNRINKIRTSLNLFIVFFLVGLWHGASWPFIAWGCYHGLFLVIERITFTQDILKRMPYIMKHLYVLLVIILGWILFRANDFSHAIEFYKYMFMLEEANLVPIYDARFFLTDGLVFTLVLGILFSVNISAAVKFLPLKKAFIQKVKNYVLCALGILAVISISGGAYNPFIYFRF